MAKLRRFQNNFTTGEVAPSVGELYNFAKRANALSLLRNMQIRPAGGIFRRPGTRFVNLAKSPSERVRLVPFTFSRSQAYVLEFGGNYVRFYRDGGQLVDGGPVEVATPWTASQVFELDFAQEADTLVITHSTTAPRLLQRFSDINWTLREIDFNPPPTEIEDQKDTSIAVTLVLVLNQTFNIIASSPIFAETDVGRIFIEDTSEGRGRAVITEFASSNQVMAEVTTDFNDLTLGTDDWKILGPPLGRLNFHFKSSGKPLNGNKGDLASILLYAEEAPGAELVVDPTFPAGSIANWTDLSGRTISTGTGAAIGQIAGQLILATGQSAPALGIRPNHYMAYATAGGTSTAVVSRFTSSDGEDLDTILFIDTGATAPSASPTWTIRETSDTDSPTTGGINGIELITGPNGVSTLEQVVVGSQQSIYEWNVTVEADTATFRIGTSTGGPQILEPTTLPAGKHSGRFVTPNLTASEAINLFVQIENNQFNTVSRIREVSIKEAVVAGFQYEANPGDYIRVNNGYIEILNTINDNRVDGVVEKTLDDNQDALAGAWTIEQNQWTAVNPAVYPSNCAFYQGRLYLAGGQKVWGSSLTDITSFAFGVLDTDALQFTPAATQVNPIHWMSGEQFLVLGTLGEEFVVQGTDTSFIIPTDISVESPTAIGSEPIKPQRINQAILYVKGGGNRIVEFNLQSNFQERATRDLSVLAAHLIPMGDKITQIAWQEEPHQTLWCVTDLGGLFSLTYVREQDIAGWARHDSEDNSLYTSVTVIPHPDGDRDQTWFGVRRTDNATITDYIEYFDDGGGLYVENPAVTVDSAIRYNGASTTTITGLTHLANRTDIWIVDVKGPQGPLTVDGTGAVSFARAVTIADVGINYVPEFTTLRPDIEGQGPTGLVIGNSKLYLSLFSTGEGVIANTKLLKLRKPSDPMDSRIPPVTGEEEIPQIGHDRVAAVNVRQSIPETFEVLSIAGTLKIEDI